MRSFVLRVAGSPTVVVTALALAGWSGLSGCSSQSGEQPTSASPAPSSSSTSRVPGTPAPPGGAEVSPNGVTTAMAAPAASTEEEYFKACRAARDWMDQHDGQDAAKVEPYLAAVQSTDSAGPGTFGAPWSKLPPERQSAVIVAARAAADGLCPL